MEKSMIDIIKAEQRAYHADWRKNNPDKVKEYRNNYWLRRAAKKLSSQKKNKSGGNKDEN